MARFFSTSIFFLSLAFLSQSLLAKDTDCSSEKVVSESQLPIIDMPDLKNLVGPDIVESKFCVDPINYKNNKELEEDFKLIKVMGYFDDKNCLKDSYKNSANDQFITKFIQKNLEQKPINVFAKFSPDQSEMQLLYSTSSDKKMADSALTTKDKWQIAGASAGAIAIGALVSEKVYAGEADKRKHWMVGAAASGLTTGTTYLLLETAGVGDKLGLSKTAKKNIITYSGPVMALLLGIAKEVYDSKHKNKHTVDGNDALATGLGGGLVIPLVVKFTF